MINENLTQQAFESYKLYLSIKRHFETPSYDYFKYNGKVRASSSSFEKRNDIIMFRKLSKCKNRINRLVSNLISEENAWIGKIVSPEGEAIQKKWENKFNSFQYTFSSELGNLLDDVHENFEIRDECTLPLIFELFYRREISLETVSVLTKKMKLDEYWLSTSLKNNILAKDLILKSMKYYPFIEEKTDISKLTSTIKNRWNL